jgi:predicted ester cyclase
MPETKGREAVKKNLMDFVAAFPDFKITAKQIVAEGDWAMGWVELSGTFKADFMGMKANGKSFKITDVDILKINADGLGSDHWAVQDYCAMFSQLGVVPPVSEGSGK